MVGGTVVTDEHQRPRLRIGRPPISEDRRLTAAVTVRFTPADAAEIQTAAGALAVPPTTAVRLLALRGAGITDPRLDTLAELRTVGQDLARIAYRLEHRRRRPTTDDLEETRAAVADVGRAVAAALAKLGPKTEEPS